MKLTQEQLQRLRKPYDKVGAFDGYSEEEVEKILNEQMTYYLTLANINLRLMRANQNHGKQ